MPFGILHPDLSVRIRVPIGEPQAALLISDAAVVTDLDRKFLFVLNDKDEVEQRLWCSAACTKGCALSRAVFRQATGSWFPTSSASAPA